MLFSVTDRDPHLVTVKDRPHLWHPYFPCSSAIIEHTNRVIFLEDDDIAAVADGKLSIHRVKRSASDDPSRAIQTLQMELQQIMKGRCPLRVPVQQPHGAGALWGSSWDSLPCYGWVLQPSCLLWAPDWGCRWSVVHTSQGMWGAWPGYSKGASDHALAPGLPAWTDPSPSTTSLYRFSGIHSYTSGIISSLDERPAVTGDCGLLARGAYLPAPTLVSLHPPLHRAAWVNV